MDIREELKSGGAYPEGPVSAWPQERNESLLGFRQKEQDRILKLQAGLKASPTAGKMVGNLFKTTKMALQHGKVSEEIRKERYDTCKSCPFFNAESKRCNDCGCFMEAKTWVGGDPDMLCPQKKWSR